MYILNILVFGDYDTASVKRPICIFGTHLKICILCIKLCFTVIISCFYCITTTKYTLQEILEKKNNVDINGLKSSNIFFLIWLFCFKRIWFNTFIWFYWFAYFKTTFTWFDTNLIWYRPRGLSKRDTRGKCRSYRPYKFTVQWGWFLFCFYFGRI